MRRETVSTRGIGVPEGVATLSETQTEPKLLYFYSPKSGPSRRVEAFLDQVLQERNNHEAFTRGRIDVDRAPALAEHFEVDELPTIVVLEEGRVACKVEGRVSVGNIRDALSPWLN